MDDLNPMVRVESIWLVRKICFLFLSLWVRGENLRRGEGFSEFFFGLFIFMG